MATDHDTLIAYALGTLSPEETQALERELSANPEAEVELRALQDTLADLVMDLPPEPVPAGAEQALLARVRAESPRQEVKAPRRRLSLAWPLTAAACVALLVIGVGRTPWFQSLEVQRQVQAYSARPGAVRVALQAASGQPVGSMVRLADGQVFVALDQAPTQSDRVYQAWIIAGGVARSLGVFQGRTFISTQAGLRSGQIGVTLEPPGGSPQPTSAPIALATL